MEYRLIRFIGDEAIKEGWQEIISINRIELGNSSELISVKVDNDEIITKIVGSGKILINRENKNAFLATNSRGKIKSGDKIWLLNKRAENEFNNGERQKFDGATLVIEFFTKEVDTKQDIFVKDRTYYQEKGNKKINLVMGLIVLGLLITGTVLGYQKRTRTEEKIKIEEAKNQINKIKNEIEGVRTINIETALELAKKAELIIDNTQVKEKGYSQELMIMKEEINEMKKTLGEESVDYEIAYDTNLIDEDGNFAGMAIKNSIVYIWNNTLGQINMVDIKQKSTEKIIGDDRIKLWLGIFNNGEKWYGYDQNKIYGIERNNLVETKVKEDANRKEIIGWNASFYTWDNSNQIIEKLSGEEGRNWLKEAITLKEEVVGMSIDGSIWVLGKSGKIYHYNLGIEEEYIMSFLPNLTSGKSLRTNDQVDFLAYVIDDNTVIVYGKDGKILGKYNFGKIKIRDIGIENQEKAILVLAENGKIYRIKIK